MNLSEMLIDIAREHYIDKAQDFQKSNLISKNELDSFIQLINSDFDLGQQIFKSFKTCNIE